MFDVKADEKARQVYQRLKIKASTPAEVGKAIDKAIDCYFESKIENLQLELDFGQGEHNAVKR